MNNPLRIGIDARELEGGRVGVGRYLMNLLKEWAEIAPENHYILFFMRNIPNDSLLKKECFSKRLLQLPGLLQRNLIWEQIYLPFSLREDTLDLFFSPSYTIPFLIKNKAIVTIHDISYEVNPEWFPLRESLIRRLFTRLSVKRAETIITVSEFSKNEIIKIYGLGDKSIRVIYEAPEGIFGPITDKDDINTFKKRYNTGDSFILYVGSIFNRRPIDILIKAFSRVVKENNGLRLIIIGENRTRPRKDINSLIDSLGIKDSVILLDYVSDSELSLFYKAAIIFIYPSFYEGFGLPVLEAMASGTPVIVPSLASFPEVVGDCGIFLEHLDKDEMTTAILKLIRDESLRNEFSKRGKERARNFSWRNTAKNHLDLFREVLS